MEQPIIQFQQEEGGILKFTISSIDVSFVNALRRTILSDIPIIVFKTSPYEQNKCNIISNTTRLNNEIIKHRLSNIPIHIKDLNINLDDYILEIDEENTSDTMIMLTTENFKIRNLKTNTLLDDNDIKKIFPPFIAPTGTSEYYIDFVRLNPRLSETIPGEKLKLTCGLSIGTAREDGAFNVVGTCSYGCSPNINKINEEVEIRKEKWSKEGKNKEEVEFEAKNWKLLEGMRYVIKNSFDFIIETIGIYENNELLIIACNILIDKLINLKNIINNDEIEISISNTTMENCYDIKLLNEDYTIGNMLNYVIYEVYYKQMDLINYIGFKKLHPHDNYSIIRIAFNNEEPKERVKDILVNSIDKTIEIIEKIKFIFEGTPERK